MTAPLPFKPEPDAHSKFSASASGRWMGCPGSVVLEAGKPDGTSVYAAAGTCEHTVAAECLLSGASASDYLGRTFKVEGFDIEFDDDRVENVQIYLDNIQDYRHGADAFMVEVKVNYADWLCVPKADGFGTSDTVIIKGDEIQVHDYKGGRGEEVDAENNTQMMLYALGALAELDGLAGDFTNVRMVIHQPRIKRAPSEWSCSVEELKKFANLARSRAASVLNAEQWVINNAKHLGNPTSSSSQAVWNKTFLSAGEKQCRWCKAKATCPVLRAEVIDGTFDKQPATPEEFADMTPLTVGDAGADADHGWLAASMAKAALIEGWITGVRAEVERRLLAGGAVSGYKLVQGKQGNRAWTSKAEAESMLKSFKCKLDEMYKSSLISPTDAEKLLETASPARWKKLAPLISRSPGSPSVAPTSDKRAPIVVTPVADDFAEVAAFDDLA